MAVKQTLPKFVASDGKGFDNQADAERHDTLVTATAAFEKARKDLLHAMAHTKRTADGELMDPCRWGTYFFVREFLSEPSVVEVSFYYDTEVELRGERIHITTPYHSRDRESQSYPIEALYAKRSNADRALRKLLEDRAAELQKRISKLPGAFPTPGHESDRRE